MNENYINVLLHEAERYQLEKCKYCSGSAVIKCLQVECIDCGAKTKNFTATMGEYQREEQAAISAWRDGKYSKTFATA